MGCDELLSFPFFVHKNGIVAHSINSISRGGYSKALMEIDRALTMVGDVSTAVLIAAVIVFRWRNSKSGID